MKHILILLPIALVFYMQEIFSQNTNDILRQQVDFYKHAAKNPALSSSQQLNYSEKLFDIASMLKDTNVMIFSLKNMGEIYHNVGEYDRSRKTYNQILDLTSSENLDTVRADALYNLSVVKKNEGDYSDAVIYLEQSLRIDSILGRTNAIANSYNLLGLINNEQGFTEDAIRNFNISISLFQEAENNEEVGLVYANLGFVYQSLEQNQQAAAYFDKAGNILSAHSRNARYASLLNVIQEANKKIMQMELVRKRIQTLFLLLVLVIAIAITIIFIRLYNLKKKAANTILLQKNEIEEKNHQIESSINYAQRIQMGTLTHIGDIHKALPELFILHLPKDVVSGDFYFFNDNKRYTVISAIDCTGHGIPGAFISIMGNNYLQRIMDTNEELTAGKILTELDASIIAGFDKNIDYNIEDGMDMALCLIDKKENCIRFAGAKNPLIYIEDGLQHKVTPDKFPIGGTYYQDKIFTDSVFPINDKPRTFYMFSDGFQDQFGGENNKKFKAKRMYDLFLEHYRKPFDEQHQILQNAIEEWKGAEEQTDDILVIGFKI